MTIVASNYVFAQLHSARTDITSVDFQVNKLGGTLFAIHISVSLAGSRTIWESSAKGSLESNRTSLAKMDPISLSVYASHFKLSIDNSYVLETSGH